MIFKVTLLVLFAFHIQQIQAEEKNEAFSVAVQAVRYAESLLKSNPSPNRAKEFEALSTVLQSSADKSYLQAMSTKALLPKGYTVVAALDTLYIKNDEKNWLWGIQLVGGNPLRLKTTDGLEAAVDKTKIRETAFKAKKTALLDKNLKWFTMILPEAVAEESNYLKKMAMFLTSLTYYSRRRVQADESYNSYINNTFQLLSNIGLDPHVECTSDGADIKLVKGSHSMYLSELKKSAITVCAPEKPDRKVESPYNVFPERVAKDSNQYNFKTSNLEKCVTPTNETVENIALNRAALVKELGAELAPMLSETGGEIQFENGACKLKWQSPLSGMTASQLNDLKKKVIAACEASPKIAAIKEVDQKAQLRRDFIETLANKGGVYRNFVSSLTSCCLEAQCRQAALEQGGLTLDYPQGGGTK